MSSYNFKKIETFTEQELDEAIDKAESYFGRSFWILLTGIDAYLERRYRKYKAELSKLEDEKARRHDQLMNELKGSLLQD